MTDESTHVYDKKKLIILRAALILIGGAVGGTAVWQYFVNYPELMRREFQIIITVVSACVLAALLGLSAKPFYRLFASIGAQFAGIVRTLGARGVVAVVAGLAAVGMLGFLLDVIIRGYIGVWAVRLLADILAVCLFAVLCCYGFTKWVAADEPEETGAPERECVGYLLTASCFTDERVLTAADVLCNVKISKNVFQALCRFGGDGAAAARLNAVIERGAAESLKGGDDFSSADDYVRAEIALAAAKRLKPIVAAADGFPAIDGAVDVAVFAPPTDEVKAKFFDGNGETV